MLGLAPLDHPFEGAPERRRGDRRELVRRGGETGVTVGERQNVKTGQVRQALAFRLQDGAKVEINVLVLVFRGEEHDRTLRHLHAEPVAVDPHGDGELSARVVLPIPPSPVSSVRFSSGTTSSTIQ